MITLQYIGEPTNLGRFGEVRKGDILNLTEDEGRALLRGRDQRFRDPKSKEAQKEPIPDNTVEITDKMKPADRAAAEKANLDEKARQERLAIANDPQHIETMEIQHETYDQLLARAERINAKVGGEAITAAGKVSRTDLINAILSAERRVPFDPGNPSPAIAPEHDPLGKRRADGTRIGEPPKVGDAHSSPAAAGLKPNPKPEDDRYASQQDPSVSTGRQLATEQRQDLPKPGSGPQGTGGSGVPAKPGHGPGATPGKPLDSGTFTKPKK